MSTTASPVLPLSDTPYFNPDKPDEKCDRAFAAIARIDAIPYSYRRELADIVHAAIMESWTKGYREGAEVYMQR